MADEKTSNAVSVGERQVVLERRDRWFLGGLCVALLCVLAAGTYAGRQLWIGSWALERVAPGTWMYVGVGVLLLAACGQLAASEGWRFALINFAWLAVCTFLLCALAFLVKQYGLSRVLGGALLASPLLAGGGLWLVWRAAATGDADDQENRR